MRRLAVVALLCACRHPPKAVEGAETVTVRNVRSYAGGESLFQTTLVSVWEVSNGLRAPVTVDRWPLTSTLEGRPVTGAAGVPALTVAAGGKLEVSLTQPVELKTFFEGASPPTADYVATLELEVEGRPSATTDVRLKLPVLPELQLTQLHVTKTSMSFEVELIVVLVNENPFLLNVERFSGEVRFAGNRFARFDLGALTVPGATRHPVPLRLTSGIERLNGLARAALSSTEAISTDVDARVTIEGRDVPLAAGSMVWPRGPVTSP